MSPAFPINIRDATATEFENVGKLHALAFADDPMYNLLHSAISAEVVLQWIWIEGALAGVQKGFDRVLIMEREDTKEIIGLAWFYKYSADNIPILLPESWPEGFNKEEDIKMAKPRYDWQLELLEKYGEYIYLQEFAIHPDYQMQGLGRKFLSHLASLTRDQSLAAIGLTADAGKPGFYAKCGYQQIGEPIMIGPDNTQEGVTKMLLDFGAEREKAKRDKEE